MSQAEQVRVLTPSPAAAADLGHLGVQLIGGDVRDPSSLGPAMTGVITVVSAIQGLAGTGGGVTTQSIDRDGHRNVVTAAAAARGAAVILMSTIGARPTTRASSSR